MQPVAAVAADRLVADPGQRRRGGRRRRRHPDGADAGRQPRGSPAGAHPRAPRHTSGCGPGRAGR